MLQTCPAQQPAVTCLTVFLCLFQSSKCDQGWLRDWLHRRKSIARAPDTGAGLLTTELSGMQLYSAVLYKPVEVSLDIPWTCMLMTIHLANQTISAGVCSFRRKHALMLPHKHDFRL